jgi:hypothetical protein
MSSCFRTCAPRPAAEPIGQVRLGGSRPFRRKLAGGLLPCVSVYPDADSGNDARAVDPDKPMPRTALLGIAPLSVHQTEADWKDRMHRIAKAAWPTALPIVVVTWTTLAHADTEIWTPVPGTETPDYGGPLRIERDGILYPAIKGTRTPDYGASERLIIRDGKVYNAIPGTNTPDYGSERRLLRDR